MKKKKIKLIISKPLQLQNIRVTGVSASNVIFHLFIKRKKYENFSSSSEKWGKNRIYK